MESGSGRQLTLDQQEGQIGHQIENHDHDLIDSRIMAAGLLSGCAGRVGGDDAEAHVEGALPVGVGKAVAGVASGGAVKKRSAADDLLSGGS